jgi:hypothetical protein
MGMTSLFVRVEREMGAVTRLLAKREFDLS